MFSVEEYSTLSALAFALCSAISNAVNSVVAARILRATREVEATALTFYSLLPSFVASCLLLWGVRESVSADLLLLLTFKNCLYGLALTLRFEAYKSHGASLGAVLVASQPVFVALLAFIFLGEVLTLQVTGGVVVASAGLLVLAGRHEHRVLVSDIRFLVLFPVVLISAVMVIDRYVLVERLSVYEYFVIDKLVMLPAVVLIMLAVPQLDSGNARVGRTFSSVGQLWSRKHALGLAILGVAWLLSTYLYGAALELEKAAVISVVRNVSYPLVTLYGLIALREPLDLWRGIGFLLVFAGGLVLVAGF